MNIYLYKTADNNNKVVKELTEKIVVTGVLRTECSVLNPIIEIETVLNISNYNYAKVEDFNRYYFITNIDVINDKLWKISLRCDVLMSYASDIHELDVNILRNPSRFNLMVEDNQLQKFADDRIQCYNFPNSLLSGSENQFKYYLTVIGGGE